VHSLGRQAIACPWGQAQMVALLPTPDYDGKEFRNGPIFVI